MAGVRQNGSSFCLYIQYVRTYSIISSIIHRSIHINWHAAQKSSRDDDSTTPDSQPLTNDKKSKDSVGWSKDSAIVWCFLETLRYRCFPSCFTGCVIMGRLLLPRLGLPSQLRHIRRHRHHPPLLCGGSSEMTWMHQQHPSDPKTWTAWIIISY